MAIDIAKDDLIGLDVVAKRYRDRRGRPKSERSIMRWILNGIKVIRDGEPVKLEAKRIGGIWYTTDDALREFSDSMTQRSVSRVGSIATLGRPSAGHLRATAKLRARGMCK